ncbi:hypothetical protein BaRGS_00004342, partial [Batillaria attramentaria]
MEDLTGLTEQELCSMYPDLLKRCYSLPLSHFNEWKLKANPSGRYFEQQDDESKKEDRSKQRGEEAQQRVLISLQNLGENGPENVRPMFIFSSVNFETVLRDSPHNQPPPKKRERGQTQQASREVKAKGEADILIVSKNSGLVLFEIKAVGDLKADNPEERDRDIITVLKEKVLKTLPDKENWGARLASKLGLSVPVTVVLALPNVERTDLYRLANKCPEIVQGLAPGVGTDGSVLLTRCLCQDELPPRHESQNPKQHQLPKLVEWWERFNSTLHTKHLMSDSKYMISVAAFVGPRSRITIWSPNDKRIRSLRRNVRTPGEAVHETGERYALYVLRPEQVTVYESARKRLYLSGPPGSGKTLLLIPTPNRSPVWVCSSYGTRKPSDVVNEISHHLKTNGIDAAHVSFLVDEVVDDKSRAVVNLLIKAFPESHVWCAGPWKKDKPRNIKDVSMLGNSLRCPPSIQRVLGDTERDCGEQQKEGSSEGLTFSDVLIVTAQISLDKTKFLKALRREGVSVRAVEAGSGKEELVAFPKDHAVATDISLVAGLERMVVVYVPEDLGLALHSRRARAIQKSSHPQPSSDAGFLAGLGKDNRASLWYILSRSLAHAVVIHFGEADVTDDANESTSENNDDKIDEGDDERDDSNDRDECDDGENSSYANSNRNATNEEIPNESRDSSYKMRLLFICVLIICIVVVILCPGYISVSDGRKG